MLSFLRRRFDELATIVFLLLALVLTILHPPVYATAGGLTLARWVLWGAGILLVALLIGVRFNTRIRPVLDIVLQIGPMVVAVVGYVSLRLFNAGSITNWLGISSKDPWMMAADIAPGQRILEAGVGSGALSMTVLRAGASIVGYELREDFAERAKANVAAALGPDAPYRIEIRDVTEGIDATDLDRILLDMPEPHKVVTGAAEALRPGGILLAYLPTINQTALFRQRLDEDDVPFGLAETQEIMRRTWHVEARSVRPDHRMVGHTGFLTTARRLDG